MSTLQSVLVTPPASKIWDLAMLKQHLRVQHSAEDDLIGAYADAAEYQLDGAGGHLQRALITQTWRDAWTDVSDIGILRYAPVVSVESVKILLADGSEHTVDPADYYVISEPKGHRLHVPRDVMTGLDASLRPDRIRCEYVAGYGATADKVPTPLLQAHRLLVAHYYENREAVQHVQAGSFQELPMGVRALLGPFRRYGVEAWAQ